MSSIIEFSDGTVGLVGDDGWVDELDATEITPELETTPALETAFIDSDTTAVVDTELPQRIPLVGPPTPVDLPVELIERFADAVRQWADQ